MKTIYIFGHKNPDTDSVCSAIAYADLKSSLEKDKKFVPARLGNINLETEFALKYFNIPVPKLLEGVHAELSDIPLDKPLNIPKDAPMHEVWNTMEEKQEKSAVIVDDKGKLAGYVTVGDIAKAYLESSSSFSGNVPIKNIVETLSATVLNLNSDIFCGNIVVAAMQPEDAAKYMSKDTLVIAGNREDAQLMAIEYRVNTLVITGSFGVSDKVLNKSKENNVTLLTTPYDTYNTVKLINRSIPIQFVMSKDIVTFDINDLVDDAKEAMLKYKYRNFPVLDQNEKPIGVLSRRHLLSAVGKKVIMVDHNERAQSADGLQQARILEIIDHHRIGSLETPYPIIFINRPVGCTATIIYNMYLQRGMKPSKSIAGIMCAAILSDTLMFKSPTCTSKDKRAAKELAQIAEIEIKEFADSMFKAGASIEDKSEEEILYSDFKEFNISGKRIGVGQINIYKNSLDSIKEKILSFMENLIDKKGYSLIFMMFTDIINEGSEILFAGDREIISKAFGENIDKNSFYLPGVVSRKKQVMPEIIRAINS